MLPKPFKGQFILKHLLRLLKCIQMKLHFVSEKVNIKLCETHLVGKSI